MPDDPPEIAGAVLGGCLPGCFFAVAIPLCAIVAAIAFATGDTHEAWTQVTVGGLCVVWALGTVARWWWRRTDA